MTKETHQLAQLLLLDAFTFALSQLLVQDFCAAAAVCCTLALALLVGLQGREMSWADGVIALAEWQRCSGHRCGFCACAACRPADCKCSRQRAANLALRWAFISGIALQHGTISWPVLGAAGKTIWHLQRTTGPSCPQLQAHLEGWVSGCQSVRCCARQQGSSTCQVQGQRDTFSMMIVYSTPCLATSEGPRGHVRIHQAQQLQAGLVYCANVG